LKAKTFSKLNKGVIMPEAFKPGCQRPPIKKPAQETSQPAESNVKEVKPAMVKVGKPAPDFTALGYHDGKFIDFSLSEYKGKWVLLCFYPGDFTFI
jgi:peroxiredoxin (alkyl hydroperoxide reductase subunit C)